MPKDVHRQEMQSLDLHVHRHHLETISSTCGFFVGQNSVFKDEMKCWVLHESLVTCFDRRSIAIIPLS